MKTGTFDIFRNPDMTTEIKGVERHSSPPVLNPRRVLSFPTWRFGMAGFETAAPNATKGSRINADVEKVLSLVRSVKDARDRVQRHTSALGYFAPPQEGEAGSKVQPISTTMQSAIADLERAVGSLHEAVDLFD